ncbi:hypothetical protein BOTBODRAFT_65156 [Botryobasidium botryosum FD-172 SS1]|uniref:Ubiquitin carboxyl-terminal hydrolase n=1 Tax=Botryobasidium botryosum (strain FD-172 SS1) TaxID=930990 RepID=A0A067MWG9_BOTB1|nr:hypothetical protein BOTBODRAFT_65156 [Botryobasidium botryosum FD-172 SS1]
MSQSPSSDAEFAIALASGMVDGSDSPFNGDDLGGGSAPQLDDSLGALDCPHLGGKRPELAQRYRSVVMWNASMRNAGGASSAPPKKRRKIQAPGCVTCGTPLHRLVVCLECPYAGCWTGGHAVSHLRSSQHGFCVDVNTGGLFCSDCDDFVHDSAFEDIFVAATLNAEENGTKFQEAKRGREPYRAWVPDERDSRLLEQLSVVNCQGRRGLLNLGSSCYLNVVLQMLIHNPLLRNFFMSDKHNSKLCKTKNCISCEMDKLFTEVYAPTSAPYGPATFLHAFWSSLSASSPDLAGYAQQDAHECFIALLNQLHAHARGSTSISCVCVVHSTFGAQLQSELTCGRCGERNRTTDPILDISLEVKKENLNGVDITLAGCLRRFTKPERLGPNEQFSCSTCVANSQDATKRLSIRRLPPVLCFQFKRFEHNSTASKIETPVRFPATLDMAPYTSLFIEAQEREDGVDPFDVLGPSALYEYELFAVVNHEGQMNTGHYTNYARLQDQWYRFDDDKVTPATLRECLNSKAYMCAYVKRHLDYKPYQRPSYIQKRDEEDRIKEREKEAKMRAKVATPAAKKTVPGL